MWAALLELGRGLEETLAFIGGEVLAAAELLAEWRGEELEVLIADARELQDDLLESARIGGSVEERGDASA